ncbi:type II toxin-antitoxin system VapC family toxin [soil metagenome]
MATLYLDSSAVLRATIERGTSPEIEDRIRSAEALVTSRLSLVESARAFLRLRQSARVPDAALAREERSVGSIWTRCEVLQLTEEICEFAERVAPRENLRSLDALHLSTFVAARRRLDGLELLTADERLGEAAASL